MALLPQLLHSPALSTRSHTLLKPQPCPHSSSSSSSKFSHYSFQNKTRNPSLILRCSSFASDSGGGGAAEDLVELPLFPLPLVLFPGAILPLQIFEFRYRVMMHTLLQNDLRFGVVFSDGGGAVAEVGCFGEVVKHERLVDDRFFLICKGQERFRVARVLRSKPYLVANVAWLKDWSPPVPMTSRPSLPRSRPPCGTSSIQPPERQAREGLGMDMDAVGGRRGDRGEEGVVDREDHKGGSRGKEEERDGLWGRGRDEGLEPRMTM